MSLKNDSPHLSSVIRGLIRKKILDSDLFEQVEKAFLIAKRVGGLSEVDFVRNEEISFNPLPARLSLILIKEAMATEENLILASILSAVGDRLKPGGFVSEEIYELAKSPFLEISELKTKNQHSKLIALCYFLDRARHIHQIEADKRKTLWPLIYNTAKEYQTISCETSERLDTLIRHWTMRFETKYLSKLDGE